jgi:predicted transcriptional regulator
MSKPLESLTGNQQFIVRCLVSGYSQSQIAMSLGVSESAVSQQIDTYALRERAGALRMRQHEELAETDTNIASVELKALRKLNMVVDFIADPMKLARIAKEMNSMQRRSQPLNSSSDGGGQIVNIILPATVAAQFKFNSSNEAIEIDGRTLVSTTGAQMLKELQQESQAQQEAIPQENQHVKLNLRPRGPAPAGIEELI